jgi:hypothetical protein
MGGVQWPRIQRQSTLQTAGKSSSDSASHYKFYAVFMESAKVDGKAYSGDLLVPVQLQVQFTGFQDVNDGVIKTVQTPPQRKEQECATGRQRQSASISTSYCEVASGYDVEPPVYTNTGMRSLTDHKDYGDWPRIEPFPADLWHRKIVEPIEEDRFPKVDERVYALPAVAPIKTNYAKASVTNQMNARKRKERNSSDESDGTLLNNLPSATEKKPKAQNSIDSPIVNRRSPRYNFRQERQFVGQIDRQAAETLLLLNV